MADLYYDIAREILVLGPQDARPFVPFFDLFAGQSLPLTLWGLSPSGDPSTVYNVVSVTGAVLNLSVLTAGVATLVVSVSTWVASGSQLTGTLSIPSSVVFPTGQQYLPARLAVDLTLADGSTHHIETACTLRNPALPPIVPLGAALGTAATANIGSTSGTVAAGDDVRFNFVINVKDPNFAGGAKGDGVTDDTAAIQAAINAAGARAEGGTVFFPVGSYKITGVTLAALSGGGSDSSYVSLVGENQQGSELRYYGPTNGIAILFLRNAFSRLENFSLTNNSGSRGTTEGIRTAALADSPYGNACQSQYFHKLFISGFHVGWHTSDGAVTTAGSGHCASEVTVSDCVFTNNDYGFANDDFDALNITFENVDMQYNTYGWYSSVPGGFSILSGSGEYNNFDIYLANPTNGVMPFSISNFRSENVGIFLFSYSPVFLSNALVVNSDASLQPSAAVLNSYGLTDTTHVPVVLSYFSESIICSSAFCAPIYVGGSTVIMGCKVGASDPILPHQFTAPGSHYDIFGCSTIGYGTLDPGTVVRYPNRSGIFLDGKMCDANYTDISTGISTLGSVILSAANSGLLPVTASAAGPGGCYADPLTNTIKFAPTAAQSLMTSLMGYSASVAFLGDLGTQLANSAPASLNGMSVDIWRDQLSANFGGTVYFGSSPTLVTAGLNGHAYLHYVKASKQAYYLNSAFTIGASESIVTVMRCNSDSWLLGATTSNKQIRIRYNNTQTVTVYSDGGSNNQEADSDTASDLSQWSVIEFRFSDGQVSFYQNGTSLGSFTFTNTLAMDAIGAFSNSQSTFDGDIAAVVKVPTTNSASTATLLMSYYGL